MINAMRRALVLAVLFVLFCLAFILSTDNSTQVAISFLEWQTGTWPVSWWVLSGFAAGIVTGLLMAIVGNWRLRMAVRKTQKKLVRTQAEVDQLRALPKTSEPSEPEPGDESVEQEKEAPAGQVR